MFKDAFLVRSDKISVETIFLLLKTILRFVTHTNTSMSISSSGMGSWLLYRLYHLGLHKEDKMNIIKIMKSISNLLNLQYMKSIKYIKVTRIFKIGK